MAKSKLSKEDKTKAATKDSPKKKKNVKPRNPVYNILEQTISDKGIASRTIVDHIKSTRLSGFVNSGLGVNNSAYSFEFDMSYTSIPMLPVITIEMVHNGKLIKGPITNAFMGEMNMVYTKEILRCHKFSTFSVSYYETEDLVRIFFSNGVTLSLQNNSYISPLNSNRFLTDADIRCYKSLSSRDFFKLIRHDQSRDLNWELQNFETKFKVYRY